MNPWDDRQPGSFQRIAEQAAATILAALVLYIVALISGIVRRTGTGERVLVGVAAVVVLGVAFYFTYRDWVASREHRTRSKLDVVTSLLVPASSRSCSITP